VDGFVARRLLSRPWIQPHVLVAGSGSKECGKVLKQVSTLLRSLPVDERQ
jgi:hypothetical protein